ncbi:MAG: FG-GAP repeat domain-containing protein [Planctomycetota bacterium]|jgi:hypothetical protein
MRTFSLVLLIIGFAGLGSVVAQDYISSGGPGISGDQEGVKAMMQPGFQNNALGRGWTATTSAPQLSSPKFADLDGDGKKECVLSTYGITNPYGEGFIHAWNYLGTELPGFPINTVGPPPGTPALVDLNGDLSPEIIQGTWTYLYVFQADGSSLPGWPKGMNVSHSAAVADLDGDGDLEIIVPSGTKMHVFDVSGSPVSGFPVTASDNLTEAAIGDLDNDGDLEIVAGSYVPSGSVTDFVHAWHHDGSLVSGFPVTTGGSVKAAPALADLDRDGTLEVIADCWSKSATDFLYVWDHTGNSEPGWPINIPYIRLSSPSVADLDGDDDLEIVVGGLVTSPSWAEQVNALHHDATTVAGFPVSLPNTSAGNINSTCVTGDIDGDGLIEIVVKGINNIFALNHDGTMVTGYPVFLNDTSHSGTISPTPALGDPDGDGLVEIFAASTFDNVMLIDEDAVFSWDTVPWPAFRMDKINQGIHTMISLMADVHTLSAGAGGTIDFSLDAGSGNANRKYALLGSVTGIEPGTLLPGGKVLPLAWDPFTDVVLSLINTSVFFNFLSMTDGSGTAQAVINAPPLPPIAIGVVMHYAYCLYAPFSFASTPVEILIEP